MPSNQIDEDAVTELRECMFKVYNDGHFYGEFYKLSQAEKYAMRLRFEYPGAEIQIHYVPTVRKQKPNECAQVVEV